MRLPAMKISDCMLKETYSCLPETPLDEAAEVMFRRDCGSIPVLDEEAHVIGMITDRDICMCGMIEGRPLRRLSVSHAMAKEVWSCRPEDSVENAQTIMETHSVSRLPVVDESTKLVGILRLGDIARVATNRRNGPKATELVKTLDLLSTRHDVTGTEAGAIASTTADETN
jgi:CBS domain-containing protein